jgi:hypothetical protein
MSDWSGWYDDQNHAMAFGALDLRERLSVALMDENGLRPTNNALDVLIAVARELDRVDDRWTGEDVPPIEAYAVEAERTLRVLRKNQ